jgi:hypothetical protein
LPVFASGTELQLHRYPLAALLQGLQGTFELRMQALAQG